MVVAELIPHQAKREDLQHTPWVGTVSRWVPGCKFCESFEDCRKIKGVKEDTDACQWPQDVRRFRHKGLK